MKRRGIALWALLAVAVAAAGWRMLPALEAPAVASATGADAFAGVPGELTLVAGHTGGTGNLPGRGTEARLGRAASIAGGPGGEAYVLIDGTSQILRIDPDGVVTDVFEQGIHFADPAGKPLQLDVRLTSLALAPDGAFIAAAGFDNVVIRIERDGRAHVIAGQKRRAGHSDGVAARSLLNAPTDVAVANDGTIYIADALNAAVRRVGPDGAVDTFYRGRSGAARFSRVNPDPQRPEPFLLAVDSSDRLWMVARRDPGENARNHALFRFDAQGRIEATIGRLFEAESRDGDAASARWHSPIDVSADAEGNVWVAEAGPYHAIRKVAPNGQVSTISLAPCEGFEFCAALTPHYPARLGRVVLGLSGRARVIADSLYGAYYTLRADGRSEPLAGLRPCVPATDGPRADACLSGIVAMARHPDGSLIVIDAGLRRIAKDGSVRTLVPADARIDLPSPALASSTAAGAPAPPLTAPENKPAEPRRGLAIDAQGTVFYGMVLGGLARLGADGRLGLVSDDPSMARPFDAQDGAPQQLDHVDGLALMGDGALVVAEGPRHVVHRFDTTTGKLTPFAGRRDERGHRDGPLPEALFSEPQQLAVAPDGTLYVGDDNGIRAVSTDGAVRTVYGRLEVGAPPSCGMRPDALAVAGDGTLWFATSDPPRVWRMKPGFAPELVAGDRVYEGLRLGKLPGSLAPVRALLPTADGGVLIASGSALLKALPPPIAAPVPASAATTGRASSCGPAS